MASADRSKKKWSDAELLFLETSWGNTDFKFICSHLQRTPRAIKLKAAELELGGAIENRIALTVTDIRNLLNIDYEGVMRIAKKGLKHKRKRLSDNTYNIYVEYEQFIKWLASNPDSWKVSRSDKDGLEAIGLDRNFINKKAKEEQEHLKRNTLTEQEVKRMLIMRDSGFTRMQIAEKMDKDFQIIKTTMAKYTNKKKGWTDEEKKLLLDLKEKGFSFGQISVKLNKPYQTVQMFYNRNYKDKVAM